jgi:polysaccharide deacetylase 2 family uncharacterized protein YibQ
VIRSSFDRQAKGNASMISVHRRGFLAVAMASAMTTTASSKAPTDLAPPAVAPAASVVDAAPVEAPATPIASVPATPALPRWQRYAVARPINTDRPAITIVVDDLGVVHPATERVVAMPGPLTLSWFPFARNLAAQVAAGAARGHETTLHMPMQSFGLSTAWTGPDPLRIDLPEEVNLARLRAAIAAVPNTVGLNNHMGSVATRDPALMALVARECKAHDMLFLDSVVVAHSFGYSAAHDAGVPAASRDIFIDHSPRPEDIREQLQQIEAQARRRGHVIAIGHPWPHTVAALEEWLPTLKAKGFELWPLSAMVARRNDIKMPGIVPA